MSRLPKNHASSKCNESFGEFFHLSAARIFEEATKVRGNERFWATAVYIDNMPSTEEVEEGLGKTMKIYRLKNDLFFLIATGFSMESSGLSFHLYQSGNTNSTYNGVVIKSTDDFNKSENFKFLNEVPFKGTFKLRQKKFPKVIKDFRPGYSTGVIAESAENWLPADREKKNSLFEKVKIKWIDNPGLLNDSDKNEIITIANKVISGCASEKMIVWSREVDYEPYRNMNFEALHQLMQALISIGIKPILFGEELKGQIPRPSTPAQPIGIPPDEYFDMREIHEKEPFLSTRSSIKSYSRQLYLLHYLYSKCNTIGIVGAKSGFIDGAAFMGIPVITLESKEDSKANESARMHKVIRPTLPDNVFLPTSNFLKGPVWDVNTSLTNTELNMFKGMVEMFRRQKTRPTRNYESARTQVHHMLLAMDGLGRAKVPPEPLVDKIRDQFDDSIPV